MSLVRSRGRAVALLALAAAMLVVGPTGVSADPTITDVGWWTRQPLASAPEGGFQIGDAPDGEVSVAAVRIAVDGEVVQATLTLTEAGGQGDLAAIRACLADPGWTAAAGGPMDERPAERCEDGSVELVREGTTWTGNLESLLAGQTSGDASVTLVPGEADGGAATIGDVSGWSVTFQPPQLSAQSTSPSTTTRATTTTTSTTTTTTTTTRATATGGGAAPPTTGSPTVTAPRPTTRPAPPPTTAPVTTAPAPTTRPATAPTTASQPQGVSTGGPTGAPIALGRGQANPDRVNGFAIIPYLVLSLAIGAAAAVVKLAIDREVFRGLFARVRGRASAST